MSHDAATCVRGRVMVAGIGNIFLGDDGFGVEVAARIGRAPVGLPDTVDVVDYGIRGVHLAYELLDGRHETLVLVDAVPLGEPPGTLAVLEVDAGPDSSSLQPDPEDAAAPTVDPHSMSPDTVLQVLHGLGGHIDRVLVVGCQPAVVDEGMELSEAVAAAVPQAVDLVLGLARDEVARLDDRGVG